MFVVDIEYWHLFLQNDYPVIQLRIYKMHGAAGKFDSVSESLLLGLESREGRQERRMNIEDALRKLLYKPGREQSHVPGQANQINFMLFQRGDNFAVMLFPCLAFGRNRQSGQSQAACDFEPTGISFIGDDYSNPRIGDFSRGYIPGDGLEVRAASRKQDPEVLHGSSRIFWARSARATEICCPDLRFFTANDPDLASFSPTIKM